MSSSIVPQALAELIEALAQLPGVGTRSAERYAYYLFKSAPHKSLKLESSLKDLHSKVKYCPVSFALISDHQDVSPLYEDSGRDKAVIAVVANLKAQSKKSQVLFDLQAQFLNMQAVVSLGAGVLLRADRIRAPELRRAAQCLLARTGERTAALAARYAADAAQAAPRRFADFVQKLIGGVC